MESQDTLRTLLKNEDREDVVEALDMFIAAEAIVYYIMFRLPDSGKLKGLFTLTKEKCLFIACTEKWIFKTHLFQWKDMKCLNCATHRIEGEIMYNIKLTFTADELPLEHVHKEDAVRLMEEINRLVK